MYNVPTLIMLQGIHMQCAKQKQFGAVKKGTTKQSRINAIIEFDW